MKIPTGYVVYSGPSRINQEPILGLAVLNSKNEKTGNMVQLYIINALMSPLDAANCNANISICGSCPMRKHRVGTKMVGACYVNLGYGPRIAWESYQAGKYPTITDFQVFSGRAIRFGAYGDPTALPIEVLEKLAAVSTGWTGFTHRWMLKTNQEYRKYCMASCDSEALADKARLMGWNTFRHKLPEDPLKPNELMCPADPHQGITCLTCRKCDGCSMKNFVIDRHGPTAHHFKER